MAGAVLQMRPQKGSSVSRRYCTEKNLPEESSIVLDMPMSYYHCQPTFTFYMHIPVIDIWKILSITKQIIYYLLKLSWLPAKIKLVKHSLIVLSSISEPSPFRVCKWPITLFSENCQREIRVLINKQCERNHMENLSLFSSRFTIRWRLTRLSHKQSLIPSAFSRRRVSSFCPNLSQGMTSRRFPSPAPKVSLNSLLISRIVSISLLHDWNRSPRSYEEHTPY